MTEPDRNAHAFWILGGNRGAIQETPLPCVDPGLVLIRTLYSGISRGTESLVFQGRVPEREYARMRAPFQEGDFPAPVKYGYASVGIVEQGPPELEGQQVFCLYPHQDRYVVPAEAVIPLPKDCPPERAILAANAETALNALWDAAPRLGDRITIVGAGTTGMLAAALAARIPGVDLDVIDPDPAKAAAARQLGLMHVTAENASGERDIVIHTSGHAAGLRTALGLAGFEATVLELSWYGTTEVNIPLGEAFHAKRLTLASSQVGSVSPARRARRSHRNRLETALQLVADPAFDTLITGESLFNALPDTLARVSGDSRGVLCHRIRYPAADET